MFLVLIGVLALLTVPLAGGRLSALVDVRLRAVWLIGVALGAQVLFITVLPDRLPGLHAPAHIVTYVLAGCFVWANRFLPALWLIALGGALNFAAIAANAGVMPASPGALAAAGLSADKGEAYANSAAVEDANLPWLGDAFAIPQSWPLSNVFSIGDVLIVAGLLACLHLLCASRLAGARRRDRAVPPGGIEPPLPA